MNNKKRLELLADEAILNRRELARVRKSNAQLLEALKECHAFIIAYTPTLGTFEDSIMENTLDRTRAAIRAAGG